MKPPLPSVKIVNSSIERMGHFDSYNCLYNSTLLYSTR